MRDVTVRKGFGTTPTTPETTALTYLIRDIGNHGVGSPQVTMTLAQRAADLFEDGGWQRCYLNPAPTSPTQFVREHLRVEPAELIAAMSVTRAAATRAPSSTSLRGGVSEDDQRRVQALLIDVLAGPVSLPGRTPNHLSAGQDGDDGNRSAERFSRGDTPFYRRRRLLADAPELIEQVDAGQLSLADAWREHTGARGLMSLNGSPEQIAERLRARLGDDLADAVAQALHIPPGQAEADAVAELVRRGARPGDAALAEAIRTARSAGATQELIAQAAGVSYRTVRRWERAGG